MEFLRSRKSDKPVPGEVELNPVQMSDYPTYRELGKSVVGQFQLVYVCATDEDTYRIFVPWLRGSSDSCRFGGRRLVIMLHPANGFSIPIPTREESYYPAAASTEVEASLRSGPP
jgi:hypothetical protein